MNDRCYNCRRSSSGADPSHHTCVSCGGKSCRTCFGAPANNTKGKDYVCNWCLRDYVAKNGSARLLRPVKGRMLCFLCGCTLNPGFWSQLAGICEKSCGRQYCEMCLALTSMDTKDLRKRGSKSNIQFAVVQCIFCVGPEVYARNRRFQIESILKVIFPSAGVSALLATSTGTMMRRDELQRAPAAAITLGEIMWRIYWMGLRQLFEEFLPVLMNVVILTARPTQGPSIPVIISPMDMLYYLRPSGPGETTLASPKMLEMICVAHAAAAEKKGQALVDTIMRNNPALRIKFEGGRRKRVAFLAADLLKQGPTLNLVGSAIMLFSKLYDADVDVWVVGDGPVDLDYPPAKDLSEFFKARNRLIMLDGCHQAEEADGGSVLKKFLEFKPDAVFSFPGWTHGDRAWLLSVMAKLGTLTFNLIGYPGPMHFPREMKYRPINSS